MCKQKEPDFNVEPPAIDWDAVRDKRFNIDWFDLIIRWFLVCGIGFNLLIFFAGIYYLYEHIFS